MPEGPIVLKEMVSVPPGESMARSEAPRGELVYFLRSDGTDTPQRLKWRVPTYMNWEALQVMMANCQVADIPLIVNSIDPCISCMERILVSDVKLGRSEIMTRAEIMEKCREKTRRLMGA